MTWKRCPHCGKELARVLHQSARKDGKGHWPLAKRRHRLSVVEQALLRNCLDACYRRLARRELAEYLGVGANTVSRWRTGFSFPSRDTLERIVAWVRQVESRASE